MAKRSRNTCCLEEIDSDSDAGFEETNEGRERREKRSIEQAKKLHLMYKDRFNSLKIDVVKDKKDTELLKDSRLHLLNDDCLYSIFDHLNIVELSRISRMDKYFQVLIQRVIGKKLININYLFHLPECFTNLILKQFGRHFRKVTCTADFSYKEPLPLERFLVVITKHCSPNTFTEVEMKFVNDYLTNPDIVRLSIPYFSKVQKLVLRELTIHENNCEFFKALANNLTDLRTLTLDDVRVIDPRLQLNFDFSVFLKSKPKLRTFNYHCNSDIPPLLVDTLKQDCTNLETYNHLYKPHRFLDTIPNKMKDRYNYLSEIVNLKNVTMTSYTQCASDLCYPLQKLAAKNQLESLTVYVNIGNVMELLENERLLNERQRFRHFTSLRNIDIKIESVTTIPERYDLRMNSLFHFMSTCPFLNRVRIIGQLIDNVNRMLEIVPNIRVLCLAQVTMKYLPVEIRKIVQSAKKIRKRQMELGENRPLLHLNLNLQQWREVQVYKNIDDILTYDIDGTKYFGLQN